MQRSWVEKQDGCKYHTAPAPLCFVSVKRTKKDTQGYRDSQEQNPETTSEYRNMVCCYNTVGNLSRIAILAFTVLGVSVLFCLDPIVVVGA